MPWKEQTPMSQKEAFIWKANKPNRNMTKLCQEFGISRKTGYKWLKRYEQEGKGGLEEKSKKPLHSPKRTPQHIEKRILELRQQHPAWGGRKLKRRLEDLGHTNIPSASTITAILQRNDRISAEESKKRKRYQRFERAIPNDLWQMDFKGEFKINGKYCYPLTILDDHSRFLVGLKACQNQRRETVKAYLIEVFRKYGLPKSILTDNAPPWGPASYVRYHTKLSVWLMRLGIRILHSSSYHPQTLGKDERLHRSLKAEVISQHEFNNFDTCQVTFDQWRDVYNTQRPHEALEMQTPSFRYLPSPRKFPEFLPEVIYPDEADIHIVDSSANINLNKKLYKIGKAFIGLPVNICSTTEEGTYDVYFEKLKIKTISTHVVQS
jgi:transposase InsO family protein